MRVKRDNSVARAFSFLILSVSLFILSSLFVSAATCDTKTHTCSASYSSSYAYPYQQTSSTLTVYISCDISESAYAAMGSMPGKQPPQRDYSDECPQCWYDTHTYKGSTWHCSNVLSGYQYSYFHNTFPVTYYTSCSISAQQKQALIDQGYAYDHRDRTYDANPGTWTDVHYMIKCLAEPAKKTLGESCSSSSDCESSLICDGLGQCKKPVGISCSATSECQQLATCDGTVGQCRYIGNVECTSDSQCRSDLKCITGYDGRLRCTAPVVTAVTAATFSDMVGSPISSADSNDTMMLIAQGTGLNGKNVTFKAYRKQALLDSKVLEISVLPTSETTANVSFKPISGGTYYFKASVSGSEKQSADFPVGSYESNTPPIVIISSPSSGSIYFSNSNITFTHASYDPDDSIASETWKFGDLTGSTGKSVVHSYPTTGQKDIIIEIVDSRGAKNTGSVSIAVANNSGYTLFTLIDKPAYGSVISNSSLVVDFSARQSYVISASTSGTPCTTLVQCVQGQCPSATSASPSCASNRNSQIAISGGAQGYNMMSFNWTFKDGMNYLLPEYGTGKASGSKGFADTGQKNITLQLRFTQPGNSTSITSAASRDFLLLNQRQCSSSGTTWYKISNGFVTETRNTLGTASCAGLDLQAGTNDDCCPLGFSCSTASGNAGCQVDNNATFGCSSYTTQSSCLSDSADRVRNEVLWQYYNCGNSVGGNNIMCACAWNTQDNLCEFSRNTRLDGGLSGTLSSCNYITTTGECVNGYQSVEITAISNVGSDELCVGSTQILPCAKPVVELPFFSGLQLIISAVGILLIYVIHIRFVSRK